MTNRCAGLRLLLAIALFVTLGAAAQESALPTEARISVVKTASPDPATAGANVTYTITASNEGPADAVNMTVTDPLPASTTFVSIASPPGWSCTTPAAGANGTVTCTTPLFAPGSAVLTLVARVDPALAAGTTLANTATVSSSSPDQRSSDDSSTVSTAVQSVWDLGVTIADSPDPVFPSSTLTYTVTVTESGPSAATDATLTVAIPPQTTFNSISSNPGWSCTTGGPIVCTNPSLATPSTTFTIVTTTAATVTAPAIVATAQVSAASTDPNPANDTATATTTARPFGRLEATKSVAGGTAPGAALTYTIVLVNAGPIAQGNNSGDELLDVLPSSLVLVSASASSGAAVADAATSSVHWNGTMGPASSVTIAINARIRNEGALVGTVVTNEATLYYDRDGDGTNESTATSSPAVFTVTPPAVPALSEWMLLVLAGALALMGAFRLRV